MHSSESRFYKENASSTNLVNYRKWLIQTSPPWSVYMIDSSSIVTLIEVLAITIPIIMVYVTQFGEDQNDQIYTLRIELI